MNVTYHSVYGNQTTAKKSHDKHDKSHHKFDPKVEDGVKKAVEQFEEALRKSVAAEQKHGGKK